MNNEIKISFSGVLFVVLLIVGLVGTSGYFYGKNKVTNTVAPTVAPVAQQQPAKPTVNIDQVKALLMIKTWHLEIKIVRFYL